MHNEFLKTDTQHQSSTPPGADWYSIGQFVKLPKLSDLPLQFAAELH